MRRRVFCAVIVRHTFVNFFFLYIYIVYVFFMRTRNEYESQNDRENNFTIVLNSVRFRKMN